MKKLSKITFLAPCAVVLGLAPCWAGPNLTLNGKTASTDLKTIGGKAYVSIADVARALGMVVVKTGGGYEIKKAGGANPIVGVTQGKIGDVLFDGKWRFQVLSLQTPESYVMKTDSQLYDYTGLTSFNAATKTVRPRVGNKLVVIQCRITNGQNSKQRLWTAPNDDKMRSALADMDGGSHPILGYDFEGAPTQTEPMVPGAALSFPILFSVPNNLRLKDLIFTLKNNDYSAAGNDVRVSLAP